MTDQPRDLAAEVKEIQRLVSANELGLDEWGSTLLQHIAALSRELEELRRPVDQSAEVAEILERMDVGNGLWSDVPKLRAALDSAQRDLRKLGQANQNLSNRCATLQEEINCAGVTTDKLQAENARLSSPPPERADIAERQTAYREQLIASDSLSSVSAEAAVRDIDTLLQDLARASNALDDRVRMLGIVQDSLSERNRQNVELRAKCERLEKESINADGDLQLRDERIERLEGAAEQLLKFVNRYCKPSSGRDLYMAEMSAALTASQHTPHPDDIAVDRFADVMKAKLAKKRDEGRGGWDDPAVCSIADLWEWLDDHARKGDPVDVGNFAMMVWNRQQHTAGSGDGVAGD